MKSIRNASYCICLILLWCSCQPTEKNKNTAHADSTFVDLSKNYLKSYLGWNPQSATSFGFHEYDGKVRDFKSASLYDELEQLKEYQKILLDFPKDSLSQKLNRDYRILLSSIQRSIFSFENIGKYDKNPMTYASALDVSIYIQKDFAPIEERMRSIIAIEQMAPEIFKAAKENLVDSLAKPFVETAIAIARGSATFLQDELADALANVANDQLKKSFTAANSTAIKELMDFASYLEKEKLHKSHNRYAIGKDNYKKMLLYDEMLITTPEDILQMGLEELQREQALFAAVAKKINPEKKPVAVFEELKREHPTPETLISDTRRNLEAIRQFVIDKKIVTIPSEIRVSVEETPLFLRSRSTASMDAPGVFEQKATQSFYYITPVEPNWTPTQKEEWLTQFNYFTTDIISIHEAYPGHYVHSLKLKASTATTIEKVFWSWAFIEGWAHYTEKMMIEEGFGATDSVIAAKYHLAQLDESLVRLCRLIVSVKTHCEGMSLAEATKFFEDNCYYDYTPAYQEALRATFEPEVLAYSLGKLQILKLREEYKKQEGDNYSLLDFHDNLLNHGMLPVELLREILILDPELKDKK